MKPHEDSQTRTSSRFQHFFDKVASSENQSRKWTENSNQPSYDNDEEDNDNNPLDHKNQDIGDADDTSSLDVLQRDIFSMNIESIGISYLKDLTHSDC